MAVTKIWTIENLEWGREPEGRWELIDGELVVMPPSSALASTTGVTISRVLMEHIRPRRLGRNLGANAGFVLFPDRETVRVVDVAFLRAEYLPAESDRDGFPRHPPDLPIEVQAPPDHPLRVAAKIGMYFAAGTRLFWVVDPIACTVAVHTPGRQVRVLGEGAELGGGDVLPDFRVAVAELFR